MQCKANRQAIPNNYIWALCELPWPSVDDGDVNSAWRNLCKQMIACSVRRRRYRRRHRVREPTMPPRMIIGGHFLACMVWRGAVRLGQERRAAAARLPIQVLPPPCRHPAAALPRAAAKTDFRWCRNGHLCTISFRPQPLRLLREGAKKIPTPLVHPPAQPPGARCISRTNEPLLGRIEKINERLTDYAPPRQQPPQWWGAGYESGLLPGHHYPHC